MQGEAVVLLPETLAPPTAGLTAPGVIGPCSGLTLDARDSRDGGPLPLGVRWSTTAPHAAGPPRAAERRRGPVARVPPGCLGTCV